MDRVKVPTTIDAYLATLTGERRAALGRLRRTIRSIVPGAQECISYQLPAFRVGGAVIAGFSATTYGCSYYPFSGSTLGTLAGHLVGYECTKSAVHFQPSKGLPPALVRKLIEARIAESTRPSASRAKRAPAKGTRRVSKKSGS